VWLCSSSDGATCTGTPWNQGWIVQPSTDPFNPNTGQPGKPLQVVGALPPGTTLNEVKNNTTITFMSNGALGPLVNPETAVVFKMCDSRGPTFARYLQISAMGRVSASQTAGQDLTGATLTTCL
jgi:hypothetical protein